MSKSSPSESCLDHHHCPNPAAAALQGSLQPPPLIPETTVLPPHRIETLHTHSMHLAPLGLISTHSREIPDHSIPCDEPRSKPPAPLVPRYGDTLAVLPVLRPVPLLTVAAAVSNQPAPEIRAMCISLCHWTLIDSSRYEGSNTYR